MVARPVSGSCAPTARDKNTDSTVATAVNTPTYVVLQMLVTPTASVAMGPTLENGVRVSAQSSRPLGDVSP